MGMDMADPAARGLVLLGCGRMGSALLQGWLKGGLPEDSVWIVDPAPSDVVTGLPGVHLNEDLPARPALLVVAVKPQKMAEALPSCTALGGGGTVVLSVAAGTTIAAFEDAFGPGTPVIRAMPNTPAAIGRGISAMVGNAAAAPALDLGAALLGAVGEVVRLEDEAQMDAVTGVSGSGPAYVFHLIETLAAGGVAEGLPPELALRLARATVAGAGALAVESGETPEALRVAVTSPNGTTQAALEVLMDLGAGFPALLPRAVAASAARSRELSA